MEYFTHLKINSTYLLLIHTRMSIKQIANKLSFSDSQYFERTFRKVMGTTSTNYRKQNILIGSE